MVRGEEHLHETTSALCCCDIESILLPINTCVVASCLAVCPQTFTVAGGAGERRLCCPKMVGTYGSRQNYLQRSTVCMGKTNGKVDGSLIGSVVSRVGLRQC
jgi:hypothetical protein